MLLRTQAIQVVPVYEQFLKRFPNLTELVDAGLEEVIQVLYPLGLKWRADYVYEAAVEIQTRFGGQVPESMEELQTLPGVSHYIAAAIRNFGLEKPEPLIDTNTVRIASRLFGLQTTDSSRRSKRFMKLLTMMLDIGRPREYNFALLDLGALVCKQKKEPECLICPVNTMCNLGQMRMRE